MPWTLCNHMILCNHTLTAMPTGTMNYVPPSTSWVYSHGKVERLAYPKCLGQFPHNMQNCNCKKLWDEPPVTTNTTMRDSLLTPKAKPRVLEHQYTVNPMSLPSPSKCITPLPPLTFQSSISVTNPLPPVIPLVTIVPPVIPMANPLPPAPPSTTVPPPQPPANPNPPQVNPMSTATSTTEIKAALPTDSSRETKDAV